MSLRLPTRTSTFTRTLVRPLIRTASLRTAPRFHRRSGGALPLSLGLTSGLGLVALHRQQPLRFDTAPTTTAQSRPLSSGREPRRKDLLDPDTVKELSGGSLAGFFAGVLVSVFSKTLVLLAGIAMVVIQVAARHGIDLVSSLQLKQRLRSSRILAMLRHHTAFKLSFALAFSLSAFMSF